MNLLTHYQEKLENWKIGSVSDAQMGVLAFFALLSWKHGQSFYSRRHSQCKKKSLEDFVDTSQFKEILETYTFKGIRPKVVTLLSQWLAGEWPMKLITHVPSSRDIINAQANGHRVVSLIENPEEWNLPVLEKTNALEFFVHDLEHGYQFHSQFHQEQVLISKKFLKSLDERLFDSILATDFRRRFEYMLSDMNTHPEHTKAYFNALLYDLDKNSISLKNEAEIKGFIQSLT